MLEFHDIEQNTDEWLDMRAGKLTGSGFQKIMANYGKAFGDPAKKYATDIAVEIITGSRIESDFSNAHMERGHEQEPIARQLYEDEMFSKALNGGFFCGDFIGVSPDFRLDDNGLGEIKSVIPSVHFETIKRQSYDPKYKWQLIGNMHYTSSEYIDFVSYSQPFPRENQLFVFRVDPDMVREEIKMLEDRVEQFKALVQDRIKVIKQSEYIIT